MKITLKRELLPGFAQDLIGGYFLLLITLDLPKSAGELAQAASTSLVEKEAELNASSGLLVRELQPALQEADRVAEARIAAAKKVLQLKLGDRWTLAHKEAGYSKPTLEMPSTMAGRARLLGKTGAFFQKNPEFQNRELEVTAENLLAAGKALSEGMAAVDEQSATYKKLVKARDAAAAQLRSRLRNILTEVGHVLADDDVRWAQLGVDSPAQERSTRGVRAGQQKRKSEAVAEKAAGKKLALLLRNLETARIQAEKGRSKAERLLAAATTAQNDAAEAAAEVARLEVEWQALGGNLLSLVPAARGETPSLGNAANASQAGGVEDSALVA
jgi:hypothetical protein